MKITAHLGKISWSLADKVLYVGYGLVQLQQIKALSPDVYGVFSLLVALNTWIMIISDGAAVQGLIQFGVRPEERPKVNTIGLVFYTFIVGVSVLLVYLLQQPLTDIFHEPRFTTVADMLPLYCLLTLPRMFCLKLIYRDLRMRDLFIVDTVWFGIRTVMTIWALHNGTLNSLEDIIFIDFVGMGASSLCAIVLTHRELVFGLTGGITVRDYLRYGIPLAVATTLSTTPRQLDVFMIASFFGTGVVGVYNPAKNLYRFFEQAFDAVTVLIYPAAVRLHAAHKNEELGHLITKAMSVTLLPCIIALIVLESGGSNVIIPLLGPKYAAAVGHFNVLILAALGMPFFLMASVISALGDSTVIVRYSAIGLVVSVIVQLAIGFAGLYQWVGLGLVVNTIVVGVLCTAHIRRTIHFEWRDLFRIVGDARNAVRLRRGGGAS